MRGTGFSDALTEEETACFTVFSFGAPPLGSPPFGPSAAKQDPAANQAASVITRRLLNIFLPGLPPMHCRTARAGVRFHKLFFSRILHKVQNVKAPHFAVGEKAVHRRLLFLEDAEDRCQLGENQKLGATFR